MDNEFDTTVGYLRELNSNNELEDYEVWDDKLQQWVEAKNSKWLYKGDIGYASVRNPYAEINSVALYHYFEKQMVVICVPPHENRDNWTPEKLEYECNLKLKVPEHYNTEYVICKNEKQLLQRLLAEIQDSDVLSGWNSDFFDMPYITKRVEKVLGTAGLRKLSFENGDLPTYTEVERYGVMEQCVDFSGRITADYIELYKKYEPGERASYALEAISNIVLVDEDNNPIMPKMHYDGSLYDLYRDDFAYFVRYNIRDCEILEHFEQRLGYVQVANLNYHISCGLFPHVFGTLKLAELALINYCHYKKKRVVNNAPEAEEGTKISGALVLYPIVGLHELAGSIDIGSLYPNVLRSLNASPEKLRGQFLLKEIAFDAISNDKDVMLDLQLELTGETLTKSAIEWKDWLMENCYSLSGYGTIFCMREMGFIPGILTEWIIERKKYQALKKQAYSEGNHEMVEYYDRLQYVFKIKLNSLYGALTNKFFRWADRRLGESTTCSGRALLKHQCRKTNEILGGEYNVDFPTYLNVEDAIESGHLPDSALHSPKFNGMHQTDHIVYGDSVTGDTIVDIPGLRVPIEKLFTSVDDIIGEKEYCTTNMTQVLTYDKIHNTTVYKPVKYVMRHKCSKQLYRVYLNNSQWVDVTEDHSVMGYINTRFRGKWGDFMTEIKPQHLGHDINSIIYVKNKPHTMTKTLDLPIQVYELMGIVLGDGWVSDKTNGGILLSVGKKHIKDIECNLLQPLKDIEYITSWKTKPNGHDITIQSSKLRKLLREYLYRDDKKQVPEIMFQEKEENIAGFLRGLFTADGFINKTGTIALCSVTLSHILDAQELLFKCGISSTYFTENTENSFKGKFSGTYTKRLTVKSQKEFRDKIGFLVDDKQTKLLNYPIHKIRQFQSQYDFSVVTVYKVEKLPLIDDYVYDIEVEDTHTFFANNILVHNTDSTYFKTGMPTIEQAIEKSDQVAQQVNDSFPQFMSDTFLCTDQFNKFITTGREIVSDRGIFVEKKRYILHVVDVEGKRCDKMKVMGLDTKKTTLPKIIADKINNFVEQFLKGKDWTELTYDIVDYKTYLETEAYVFDIGMPKGIKGVNEYTSAYIQNPKTRLPGHVAAAILYNQCLELYNDKESLPILSGMKIKYFYLKQPHGRFKSIALPTDSPFVPQWFKDNFEIDRKAHVQRLIDNPLDNIIKAIGKRAPSKQSLLVDSVLEF